MSGHGWVTPNKDGSKARCGGPGICSVCRDEQLDLDIHGTNHAEHQRVFKMDRSVDPKVVSFHFACPVTSAQLNSLMEYLRTWHPDA